jgi:hypothetical protein
MANNIILKVAPALLNDGVEFDLKNYEIIQEYTEYTEFTSVIAGTASTPNTLDLPSPSVSPTNAFLVELISSGDISVSFNNGSAITLTKIRYLAGSYIAHSFVASNASVNDVNITWRIYK